jgi:hypothetical protein
MIFVNTKSKKRVLRMKPRSVGGCNHDGTLLPGTANTSVQAETGTLLPHVTPLTETYTTTDSSKSATKNISHASGENDASQSPRKPNSPQVSGLQSYTSMPTAGDTLSFGTTHPQSDAEKEEVEEKGEENSPTPENSKPAESDDPIMMYNEIRRLKKRVDQVESELQRYRSIVCTGATTRRQTNGRQLDLKVTPKDVVLEPFFGSKNDQGLVIEPDFFLPLLNWLRSSRMQLQASQLRKELWISALIGALRGSARRAFTAKHGKEDLNRWSFRTFELAMARMVPDYRAHFTDAAIQMAFRADTLVDDITRFELLVQYREIDANCHWIYRKLQEKLLAVQPDLLHIASLQFNLRLEYMEDFEKHIQVALNIATALVRKGSLKPPTRMYKIEKSTTRDERPFKRSRTQFKRCPFNGLQFRKNGKQEEDYSDLAKKYSRCFQCGFLLKKSDGSFTSKEEHRKTCSFNKGEFRRRMGQAAAHLKAGLDPNARLDKAQHMQNK